MSPPDGAATDDGRDDDRDDGRDDGRSDPGTTERTR
jgi:hypothetical protein